jgi:hypothetical protein
LPLQALEARAASLRTAFSAAGIAAPPVLVYE